LFIIFFYSSRSLRDLLSFPTRRSSDLLAGVSRIASSAGDLVLTDDAFAPAPRYRDSAETSIDDARAAQHQPVRRPSAGQALQGRDRKSTRLNSSHSQISYAVFCLKKKN